ncbi:hypothetical protein HanXRQr2_Chr15g0689421 [Helianthus annuus]|uniref:Uncharacterized protein n=1 Tax=Helianthus annuus TaxID=4232 RepID=A0A9K3H1V3_HELAN|nr:hypothetical protein HanXRQr2_Chr15g0689421 [Helianthus annuus]KAJ0830945.1 hypothetical protein HanPSC8_Chr15g0661281 [Helianthus annuus]
MHKKKEKTISSMLNHCWSFVQQVLFDPVLYIFKRLCVVFMILC